MIARPRIRQLGLGELLDEMFRLYRSYFLEFIAIAALVLVPFSILSFLVQLPFQQQLAQFQNQTSGTFGAQSPFDSATGLLYGMLGSFGLSFLYLIVFQPLMEGALARAISQRYLNQTTGVGDAFGTALRRSPALIGARLLPALFGLLAYGVVIGIIVVGFVMVLGIGFSEGNSDNSFAGAIVILLGFAMIFVFATLGLFFVVRFLFTSQAIIVENQGPLQSLGRSWRLTQQVFWRTFGYLLIIWMLTGLLPTIVSAVFSTTLGIFLANQQTLLLLISTIISAIIQVIITPFSIISYTLMYYDLRVRKEGFDLEQQTSMMASPNQFVPPYQVR